MIVGAPLVVDLKAYAQIAEAVPLEPGVTGTVQMGVDPLSDDVKAMEPVGTAVPVSKAPLGACCTTSAVKRTDWVATTVVGDGVTVIVGVFAFTVGVTVLVTVPPPEARPPKFESPLV